MLFNPTRLRDLINASKTVFYILFNVSQLISATISIFGTSLGIAIITWFLNRSQIALYVAAFSAGILVASLSISFSYWRAFPYRWLVRGYRWVRAEYLYQIYEDDTKHHSQTVTILLEAIRPGVDHFENRYFWTGSGTEKEPVILSAGHKMMGSTLPRSGWKIYYVHLGQVLNVGDKIEVKIFQDLYDENGKFEPFLAKTVLEPLDDLTLRILLPRNKPASQVTLRETHSDAPTFTHIKQTAGRFEERTGEITWHIPYPMLGHRYVVDWRY